MSRHQRRPPILPHRATAPTRQVPSLQKRPLLLRPLRHAGFTGGIVVAEASSAAEAKAVVARSRPQIVLLDLKLSTSSDTEGLDLCADLTSAHPELGVLVLTTFLDENLVQRAVRAGARGYVVKDVDTSALIRAIRDVSRGESAFDARSASAMVRGLNQAETPSARQLTSRETEVLRLLARGMSNRDIGGRL